MDYKFLDKVVDQIVSETRIDYNTQEGDDEERIYTPFSSNHPNFPFKYSSLVLFYSFTKHCKEVYGLNEDEINYVWNKYKNIIKDKIIRWIINF
jgi:hypothetical protein